MILKTYSVFVAVVLLVFGTYFLTTRGSTTLGVSLLSGSGTTSVAVTLNSPVTGGPNDLTSGLVGHWTFDGTDITASTTADADGIIDRSGQGNHGQFSGGATTSAATIGKVGQALEFDGSDDRVQTDAFTLTSNFTFSAWVRPNTTTCVSDLDCEIIFMDNSLLDFNDGNTYRFCSQASASCISVDINNIDVGQWQLLTGTRSGTTCRLYKNGVRLVAGSCSTDSAGSKELFIGRHSIVSRHFNGVIDDVRVYNRTLSAEEIKRLYDLGATTHIGVTINPPATGGPNDLTSGLVGHWTFDGPDLLQNAADRSGQGKTGYLQNFTSTTTVAGKIGQALEFDGIDDYIDVGQIAQTPPATITAWVRPDAGSTRGIFGTNHPNRFCGIHIKLTVGNSPQGGMGDCGGTNDSKNITTDTTVSEGAWSHVAAVFNAWDGGVDDIDLYINGVKQSVTQAGTDANGVGYAGSWYTAVGSTDGKNGTNYADGSVDDVRAYDRALSVEEIKRLYDLGR